MRRWFVAAVSSICLLAFSASAFAAFGWEQFKDRSYGFSMLVPKGARQIPLKEGKGWTGVQFDVSKDTQIWVYAKQGDFYATPEELRKFAVKASDIPANNWTPIKEMTGKNISGFKWLESYHASGNSHWVIAMLGVGPKGDFVIFLGSNDAEYHAYEADFEKWFSSIKVF